MLPCPGIPQGCYTSWQGVSCSEQAVFMYIQCRLSFYYALCIFPPGCHVHTLFPSGQHNKGVFLQILHLGKMETCSLGLLSYALTGSPGLSVPHSQSRQRFCFAVECWHWSRNSIRFARIMYVRDAHSMRWPPSLPSKNGQLAGC